MDRSKKKFYASPSYLNDIELMRIGQDISKNCTLTPADVAAVLESFLEALPRYLMDGHPVKLGRFGKFRLSFSSVGKDTADEVGAKDITSTRIIFVPGSALKDELKNIRYEKR